MIAPYCILFLARGFLDIRFFVILVMLFLVPFLTFTTMRLSFAACEVAKVERRDRFILFASDALPDFHE